MSPTQPMNLIARFNEVVAAMPNAIAVTGQQAPETPLLSRVSYAQLNQQSDRIARAIFDHSRIDQKQASETCIGLLAGRTSNMIIGILGILKAGAGYVPIAPTLPAARQALIAKQCGMKLLLTDGQLAHPFNDPQLPVLNITDLLANSNAEPLNSQQNSVPIISAESLAYIMFTSGTTGTPKGVMIEHGNVLNLVDGVNSLLEENKEGKQEANHEREKVLLLGAIGFDATTFEIWWTLLNGGTLVTLSDEDRINPHKLKTLIEQQGITTLFMPTGFCQQLLNDTASIFASLHTLLIGGDQLHQQTVTTLRQHAPQTRVFNVYGPTENTVFTTGFAVSQAQHNNAVAVPIGAVAIPIGFALPGCEISIENDDNQPLPAGETGELVLRGKQVCRGYLNSNDLNASDNQHDQTGKGRAYRSGDLGYVRSDGALIFVGRKDNQVKINGYRIEPGEVENALLKLKSVSQAVVKAKQDEQQNHMLVAWVVLNSPNETTDETALKSAHQQPITENAILDSLQSQLPHYMLPSEVVIVERFALDNNGKIDRNALTLPAWLSKKSEPLKKSEPAIPTTKRSDDKPTINASSNTALSLADIEKQIQSVFSKALKQEVSLTSDFFDMGGNSITALKIFAKLKGLHIKLSDIMHYRTAGKLAAYAWASIEQTQQPQMHKTHDSVAQNQSPTSSCALPDLDTLTEQAKAQLRTDYQRNNQRIRQWQLAARLPFSPIQNLQASFTVPMSLGVCELNLAGDAPPLNTTQANIATLQQAIARTINKHELLRSLPVPEHSGLRHFQSYQPQSLQSEHLLQASVVDLSAYPFDDNTFFETGKNIVSDLQCNAPDLMYHFVIIRRSSLPNNTTAQSANRYYIVSIMHHSLFDRCSDELLQRDFRHFLQPASETEFSNPRVATKGNSSASFSDYVNTLYCGPQNIPQHSIIHKAKLNHYHSYKTHALASDKLRPCQTAQNFDIAVPLPASIASELPVGAAAAIYSNAICHTYQWPGIPMLFIYEARRYLNQDYYDVLGELIDYVPIALHRDINLIEAQSTVLQQLSFANQYNINFLKLMLDKPNQCTADLHPLIYPGDKLKHIDFAMFNFLGNAEPGVSYQEHYTNEVHTGPHPLPIQSFLNAIVTCYHDGLLYKIRGSYQTDVPKLRQTFLAAGEKWARVGG